MEDPFDILIGDGVIDEVLGRLKSGKEANISVVRRGDEIMAAKVYKDRTTRSFKNNADYKEGRKVRNSRDQRAMDSGSRFGRDTAEQAWKSAEANALFKLVGSGVRIPTPILFYEGVLLMDLVCDADGNAAPRLIDVAFDKDSAITLYADLVAQIISMLCCDLIHGDLSPYNILAAANGPTIIDFPQVISAAHSSRAEWFFQRDFDNIVAFVAGINPSLAPHAADGRAIWRAYVSRDLTPEFVPPPPPPPRATRGPDRRSRPDDRNRGGVGRGPQQPPFDQRLRQQRPNGSNPRGPSPGRSDRTRGPTSGADRPDYAADPPRPPAPPLANRPAYAADPPRPTHDPRADGREPPRRQGRGPQHPQLEDRGPPQPERVVPQRWDGRGAYPTAGRPISNDRGWQLADRGSQPRNDGRRRRGSNRQGGSSSNGRGPQQRAEGYGAPTAPPPSASGYRNPPPQRAAPSFERPPPPRFGGGGGDSKRPAGNARRRPRRRG